MIEELRLVIDRPSWTKASPEQQIDIVTMLVNDIVDKLSLMKLNFREAIVIDDEANANEMVMICFYFER